MYSGALLAQAQRGPLGSTARDASRRPPTVPVRSGSNRRERSGAPRAEDDRPPPRSPGGAAGRARGRPVAAAARRRRRATATTATSCTSCGRAGSSAFGYVDQPPLTPLLAARDGRAVRRLAGRAAAAVGAGRRAGRAAHRADRPRVRRRPGGAAAGRRRRSAVSAVLLAVGHLLSTTTFDLLGWTALSWLLVRALRDGGAVWLARRRGRRGRAAEQDAAGVPAGRACSPASCRRARGRRCGRGGRGWAARSRWRCGRRTWSGRRRNGLPQLELAGAIAAGQLRHQRAAGTCSCPSSWCWSARCSCRCGWSGGGGWPATRCCAPGGPSPSPTCCSRSVFLLTGGKPYYLAGLYPVLLAAGAAPVLGWARRGARRTRTALLGGGAGGQPGGRPACCCCRSCRSSRLAATPVVDVNYDAGETVGWPAFAATVARVRAATCPPASGSPCSPATTARPARSTASCPRSARRYSGHNSYWTWGPPPEDGDHR